MKKTFRILSMLLIAVVGFSAWSCSDDKDKDEPISAESLPAAAKTFLNSYFSTSTVIYAVEDNDSYEVTLSGGTKIDFNKNGEWQEVDALPGQTIPNGFYPMAIDEYIGLNYDGAGINSISKEVRGYDVELVTGADLLFSYEGSFIGLDRD